MNYTGTLPGWITEDAANNRLVGSAGTYRAATKAAATALAQAALDAFAAAALAAGTLTCGSVCPEITWVEDVDIQQGIGSNSHTLSNCAIVAEGTAGTGAPNIPQGSLFDFEAYFHYTNNTADIQTITITGSYSIHAEYPSSPDGFAESFLHLRASDHPSNAQIDLFEVDVVYTDNASGNSTSAGTVNFSFAINPAQTVSLQFWLIQQVQSNIDDAIVVGLATGTVDLAIAIA